MRDNQRHEFNDVNFIATGTVRGETFSAPKFVIKGASGSLV